MTESIPFDPPKHVPLKVSKMIGEVWRSLSVSDARGYYPVEERSYLADFAEGSPEPRKKVRIRIYAAIEELGPSGYWRQCVTHDK